jgi:hypothetical protein
LKIALDKSLVVGGQRDQAGNHQVTEDLADLRLAWLAQLRKNALRSVFGVKSERAHY